VVEQEPEHAGGKECDRNRDPQPKARGIAPDEATRDLQKAPPVEDQHREDGTSLDRDRVRVGGLALRDAERALRDDQMPGRAHGKVLGHALDQAEDRCVARVHRGQLTTLEKFEIEKCRSRDEAPPGRTNGSTTRRSSCSPSSSRRSRVRPTPGGLGLVDAPPYRLTADELSAPPINVRLANNIMAQMSRYTGEPRRDVRPIERTRGWRGHDGRCARSTTRL
jgi:hypothetical protein